jgi:hypothetical protein
VDAEEFSGLPDRDVFLALLCALCAVLSHGPMLDPSEPPRKPSEGNLAALVQMRSQSVARNRLVCLHGSLSRGRSWTKETGTPGLRPT